MRGIFDTTPQQPSGKMSGIMKKIDLQLSPVNYQHIVETRELFEMDFKNYLTDVSILKSEFFEKEELDQDDFEKYSEMQERQAELYKLGAESVTKKKLRKLDRSLSWFERLGKKRLKNVFPTYASSVGSKPRTRFPTTFLGKTKERPSDSKSTALKGRVLNMDANQRLITKGKLFPVNTDTIVACNALYKSGGCVLYEPGVNSAMIVVESDKRSAPQSLRVKCGRKLIECKKNGNIFMIPPMRHNSVLRFELSFHGEKKVEFSYACLNLSSTVPQMFGLGRGFEELGDKAIKTMDSTIGAMNDVSNLAKNLDPKLIAASIIKQVKEGISKVINVKVIVAVAISGLCLYLYLTDRSKLLMFLAGLGAIFSLIAMAFPGEIEEGSSLAYVSVIDDMVDDEVVIPNIASEQFKPEMRLLSVLWTAMGNFVLCKRYAVSAAKTINLAASCFKNLKTMLKALIDYFPAFVVEMLVDNQCISLFDLSKKESIEIRKAMNLHNAFITNPAIAAQQPDFFMNFKKAYEYVDDWLEASQNPTNSTYKFVLSVQEKMAKIYSNVCNYSQNKGRRQKPVCFFLTGDSGLGKSFLATEMIRVLYPDVPAASQFMTVNLLDSYFSGYDMAPKAIIYDDLGATAEQAQTAWSQLLTFASDMPVSLNMANLSQKGMYFNSELIFVSSNSSIRTWGLTAKATNTDAMNRRFHEDTGFRVHMFLNPAFKGGRNYTDAIKKQSATGRVLFEHALFKVSTSDENFENEKCVTYMTLVEMVAKALAKNASRFIETEEEDAVRTRFTRGVAELNRLKESYATLYKQIQVDRKERGFELPELKEELASIKKRMESIDIVGICNKEKALMQVEKLIGRLTKNVRDYSLCSSRLRQVMESNFDEKEPDKKKEAKYRKKQTALLVERDELNEERMFILAENKTSNFLPVEVLDELIGCTNVVAYHNHDDGGIYEIEYDEKKHDLETSEFMEPGMQHDMLVELKGEVKEQMFKAFLPDEKLAEKVVEAEEKSHKSAYDELPSDVRNLIAGYTDVPVFPGTRVPSVNRRGFTIKKDWCVQLDGKYFLKIGYAHLHPEAAKLLSQDAPRTKRRVIMDMIKASAKKGFDVIHNSMSTIFTFFTGLPWDMMFTATLTSFMTFVGVTLGLKLFARVATQYGRRKAKTGAPSRRGFAKGIETKGTIHQDILGANEHRLITEGLPSWHERFSNSSVLIYPEDLDGAVGNALIVKGNCILANRHYVMREYKDGVDFTRKPFTLHFMDRPPMTFKRSQVIKVTEWFDEGMEYPADHVMFRLDVKSGILPKPCSLDFFETRENIPETITGSKLFGFFPLEGGHELGLVDMKKAVFKTEPYHFESKGVNFSTKDHFVYAPGNAGFCGTYLLGPKGRIVGKHQDSYSIGGAYLYGRSSVLFREQLEEMLEELKVVDESGIVVPQIQGTAPWKEPEIRMKPGAPIPPGVPIGDYTAVGTTKRFERVATKTKIKRSLISDHSVVAAMCDRVPAVLDFKEEGCVVDAKCTSEFLARMEEYKSSKRPEIHMPDLYVRMSCCAYISKVQPVCEVRTWTINECLNPASVTEFVERINRSTSPGALYSKWNGKGKRAFLDYNEDEDLVFIKEDAAGQWLSDRIEKFDEMARRAEMPPFLWKTFPKDELQRRAKRAIGKTRGILGSQLCNVLLIRKYFGAFIAAFQAGKFDIGSAIGVNVYSEEWSRLEEYLRSGGKTKGFGSDFVGFESLMDMHFIYFFYIAVEQWYIEHDRNWCQEDANARYVLLVGLIHSMVVHGRAVFFKHMCNPSGNALTSIVNTAFVNVILRVAWLLIFEDHKEAKDVTQYESVRGLVGFDKHVNVIALGDDNKSGVDDSVGEKFNLLAIRNALAKYGIKITPPDKGAECSPINGPIEDVEFLSNKSVSNANQHPTARWFPWISNKSLSSCIAWVRTSKHNPEYEAIATNCGDTLLRVFSSGRERYDFVLRDFKKAFRDSGYPVPRLPVYEEQFSRWNYIPVGLDSSLN